MISLGREAAACPGFRPLPGMLWRHPDDDVGDRWPDDPNYDSPWAKWGWYPDLDDDLTRLGLLALVRKAWRCPEAGIRYNYGSRIWEVVGWAPGDDDTCAFARGTTEAAALVAALKAAPEPQP